MNKHTKKAILGKQLSRSEMKTISGGKLPTTCTTLDGAGNVYSLSCPSSYSVEACRTANRQMCGINCTFTMCS